MMAFSKMLAGLAVGKNPRGCLWECPYQVPAPLVTSFCPRQ